MKRRFTEDSWRKEPWFQALVSAFRSCRSDEQMTNLLRDIATLSELKAFGERLEIAKLLGKGLSYRQVASMTGASTTTITRVADFIENGEGGYREVLKVHRHHHVRKDKAHGEEKNEENNINEQILSSEALKEPSLKKKEDNLTQKVTPLQKYLQK